MPIRSANPAFLIAVAMLLTEASGASAYTQKALYAFCGVANCANGGEPLGPLLRDPSGNIFGTVEDGGGTQGGGGVFELTPASGGGWTETMIFDFCTGDTCPYGSAPTTGVVMDTSGNLYGTTSFLGIDDAGAALELIPNKNKTRWKAKLLYMFCSKTACDDGSIANGLTYQGQASGALYDGVSPLYGTTIEGGTNDGGVVFALTPPAPGKKKWKETVIHDFCSPSSTDQCTSDGATPEAAMIMDASGSLYGTTKAAGAGVFAAGTIFELSPKGKKWKEKTLYNFCSQRGCTDGAGPNAPLLMDAAGNLLGTAGVVFKFDPATSQYTVLHTFCAGGDCSDGDGSNWGLTMDPEGDLFGTSFGGGNAQQDGTAWALDPTFQVLYTFCQVGACKDGMHPDSPLLPDTSGNLFGTASEGGPNGAGEVYELSP